MDTSNPGVLVNGDILRAHLGRRVRTVIKVLRPDADGITGISTDDKQIIVKGNIASPLTTFVEVIGIANGPQSIGAEVVTNFGDTFGMTLFCPMIKSFF